MNITSPTTRYRQPIIEATTTVIRYRNSWTIPSLGNSQVTCHVKLLEQGNQPPLSNLVRDWVKNDESLYELGMSIHFSQPCLDSSSRYQGFDSEPHVLGWSYPNEWGIGVHGRCFDHLDADLVVEHTRRWSGWSTLARPPGLNNWSRIRFRHV